MGGKLDFSTSPVQQRKKISSLPFFRKVQQKRGCRLTTPTHERVFRRVPKNYHDGRYVDTTDNTKLSWPGTTVYFSVTIDRWSVLLSIFRGLCDVWRWTKSDTFVTDLENATLLWTAENLGKLVVVRIRCVSLWLTHPHMYPSSSSSLDV